ncbi:hypothetical protein NP233_g5918 [Leucocoprinus birnbaumii]|uniref:Pet127-domain-containing protein n=1 Tax=Leucocoprinus birnbaumii TaxID=56174 RepID=A0AAD5YW08_9AGAR|nr:hypothetical protein NP233_g5918 [Leucocoprinus birnbaumii]
MKNVYAASRRLGCAPLALKRFSAYPGRALALPQRTYPRARFQSSDSSSSNTPASSPSTTESSTDAQVPEPSKEATEFEASRPETLSPSSEVESSEPSASTSNSRVTPDSSSSASVAEPSPASTPTNSSSPSTPTEPDETPTPSTSPEATSSSTSPPSPMDNLAAMLDAGEPIPAPEKAPKKKRTVKTAAKETKSKTESSTPPEKKKKRSKANQPPPETAFKSFREIKGGQPFRRSPFSPDLPLSPARMIGFMDPPVRVTKDGVKYDSPSFAEEEETKNAPRFTLDQLWNDQPSRSGSNEPNTLSSRFGSSTPAYAQPSHGARLNESTRDTSRPLPPRPRTPKILLATPYGDWGLRRAEVDVVRVKLLDGHRVSAQDVNLYINLLKEGAIQYWDAWDNWYRKAHGVMSHPRGRYLGKKGRGIISTRLRTFMEELEESGNAPKRLLKRMKEMEEYDFYPPLPGSGVPPPPPPTPTPSSSLLQVGEETKEWRSDWGEDALRPRSEAPEELARAVKVSEELLAARRRAPKEEEEEEEEDEEQEKEEDEEDEPGVVQIENNNLLSDEVGLQFTRRVEGVAEPDRNPVVLQELESPTEQQPIARLEHNLERVLFNPGVHWLQDPRSRVFNYSPHLQDIPPVTDFAFDRIEQFARPSVDPDIPALMQEHDKKFSGSTSSLSGILCHLYFLISGMKGVNISNLSRDFFDASDKFTAGQRMPTTVQFRWKRDGTEKQTGRYYLDSGGYGDEADKNILTWLGTMLEKFLTMPQEKFRLYQRSNTDAPLPEKSDKREAFRFSKTNKFIMRSQLDCHDPRLPGSGVFDIKTRACIPIRIDIFNFEENSGYLIRTPQGMFESFEREYYDLVRSAFLKYQFQVRIGGMDGVIVAYHNTKRMFGFQYIPLEEMDERLFGPMKGMGDRVFRACLELLENVAEEVTDCFPEQDVRATFETRSGSMKIWVEPVEHSSSVESAPMKMLEVQMENFLGGFFAKPKTVFALEKEWSIRWSISRLNVTTQEARASHLEARQRQLRAWMIPSGVDSEDVQQWYENLNFGGGEKGSSTFRPEQFSAKRDPVVERLREMAREGRRDTERMVLEEMGKPVHVIE